MLQKKVCVLGAFGVGKTSLVRRYVETIFSDTYLTTVGVKIDKKTLTVGGRPRPPPRGKTRPTKGRCPSAPSPSPSFWGTLRARTNPTRYAPATCAARLDT